MKLNEYIQIRRKELGLTQKDVADALNYTVQAISKYEKGLSSLSSSSLAPMAKVLKVDVDSLLRCESKKENDFAEVQTFSPTLFAKNFKYLRESKKLTQKEVANLLKIPYQSVFNWEKEKSVPKTPALIGIMELFDASAASLMFSSIKEEKRKEQYLRL